MGLLLHPAVLTGWAKNWLTDGWRRHYVVNDTKGEVGLTPKTGTLELIAKCLQGKAKALSHMGPPTDTQRDKDVH